MRQLARNSDTLFSEINHFRAPNILRNLVTKKTHCLILNIVVWNITFYNDVVHFSNHCSKTSQFLESENKQITTEMFQKEFVSPLHWTLDYIVTPEDASLNSKEVKKNIDTFPTEVSLCNAPEKPCLFVGFEVAVFPRGLEYWSLDQKTI